MYDINMSGELAGGDQETVIAESLDHLSVQLTINEEGDQPTHRCSGCGEETDQEDIVTFGVEICEGSGKWMTCPDQTSDHTKPDKIDCDTCDGSGEIEIHDWETIPLHWANSASIHARPDRDEIQVTISVGDPRGAFVMTVERRDDGLYLSVPHAGMGMSHMPLTERSAGWFKVGN